MWGRSVSSVMYFYLKDHNLSYDLPEDVITDDQIKVFCKQQMPEDEYSKLLQLHVLFRDMRDANSQKYVRCRWVELGSDPLGSAFPICDVYVRNQKLYFKSARESIFAEWITSLRLLCTSFFKILSNEIYCEAPAKLRLRAIVCTVVVPTVALTGLSMPFLSYYFNRIVGDLDCWMNGFDNNDIARWAPLERQKRSNRCFAIDLQPYGFIGHSPDDRGKINIYACTRGAHDSCVSRIMNEFVWRGVNCRRVNRFPIHQRVHRSESG